MSRYRAFRALQTSGNPPSLVLPGLQFFLDAQTPSTLTLNGNVVNGWVDMFGSGNGVATGFAGVGYNPSQVTTLFNNKNGIRFLASANNFLETPAAFPAMNWANGFTFLFAGQFKALNTWYVAADGAGFMVGGSGMDGRLGAGTNVTSPQGLPLNTSCIWGYQYSPAGGWKAIFEGNLTGPTDGSLVPGSTAGTGAFAKVQIGGMEPGNAMTVDMAGCAVYNRLLSPQEIIRMTQWMRAKYGFAAVQPTFNIVVHGNSLAIGYASASAYTMYNGITGATLAPLASDYFNCSTSGIATATLLANAPSVIDPLYNTGIPAARRVAILWEITNDLANNLYTDTVAYNNVKAWCQARKAVGWKVIVCTCLPRSNGGLTGNFETYRQSVNSQIRANAIGQGWADQIADMGGDATIGAAGASTNSTYYNADQIHLTSAGHTIAATYITTALNAILV